MGSNISAAQALQRQVEEHFNPGARVDLFLGLAQNLSPDELTTIDEKLQEGGMQLLAPVAIGGPLPWPNTLRVQFVRSTPVKGVGFLPLAVLIIGALGAVGIGGILGFKLGSVAEAVAANIIPIALIAAATIVLAALLGGRQPRA